MPGVTSQSPSPIEAGTHDPGPEPKPRASTAHPTPPDPSDVNISNPNKPLPLRSPPPPFPGQGQQPPERPSFDPPPTSPRNRTGARFHCQPGHWGAREAAVQGRGAIAASGEGSPGEVFRAAPLALSRSGSRRGRRKAGAGSARPPRSRAARRGRGGRRKRPRRRGRRVPREAALSGSFPPVARSRTGSADTPPRLTSSRAQIANLSKLLPSPRPSPPVRGHQPRHLRPQP